MSSSRASLADIQRGAQIVRRAAEEAGRDPDEVRIVVRGVVQAGRRDDDVTLSGDWEQIRAGAQLYAEAGVTELFYDLNWDPLIGGDRGRPGGGRRAGRGDPHGPGPGGLRPLLSADRVNHVKLR